MVDRLRQRVKASLLYLSRIASQLDNWKRGRFTVSPESRKWWVDHSVDVATLVATVVLAFLIHSMDSRERERDATVQQVVQEQQKASLDRLDDDQRLAVRENAAENDLHQAFVFYMELVSSAGDSAKKRAIALAIRQYASQGRLYQPAVNMFIEDIRSECDQQVFEHLHVALDAANNVLRKDAIQDSDLNSDALLRVRATGDLEIAASDRIRNCPGTGIQAEPRRAKSIDLPFAYIDMACGEAKKGIRAVPLGDLKNYYTIASARASFTDMSNIDASDTPVQFTADNVLVGWYLRALPRSGPLRNCAGGGHATLVVHMELAPK